MSILSGGMVLGQGLLVISTPFLTRLYTPEEFGLFAVFGALSSIFITMVALRYEHAIPLEQDDRTAAALVAGATLTSIVVSLVLCLALLPWGSHIAQLLGTPDLSLLLWLLPPCLLLWGIGSALNLWAIRQGLFHTSGANRIVHYGTQAGGQLGLGLVGAGGAGLVLGYALGYVARFLHLLLMLPRTDRRAFLHSSPAAIAAALRRYWQFPVFSAGAAVLQAMSAMLPAVLIALLYGPITAGLYALAQRVVGLPLRLLGESASHVFLGEIRAADHHQMIRLFKRVTALFTLFGILGMSPLILTGPSLFALVFGEAWRDAGTITQLLVPLYLARFVVTPVSQTLNVLNRQDLHLLASLFNVFALFGSFAIGRYLLLDANWTITIFSITSTMAFLFYLAVAWRHLQRADWQKLRRLE